MIPESVLNSCTCFEMYKCFAITGCVSISRGVLRFLDVFLCLQVFCDYGSVL